jgi:hypothetical protein
MQLNHFFTSVNYLKSRKIYASVSKILPARLGLATGDLVVQQSTINRTASNTDAVDGVRDAGATQLEGGSELDI